MSVNMLQAGLSLTNYLQNIILDESNDNVLYRNEYDNVEKVIEDNPPSIIKNIIQLGRPYYNITYIDVINNIRNILLPIGKGKYIIHDLYIPTVSSCTFILLSTLYKSIYDKLIFGDILSKVFTKFLLITLLEYIILSIVLYFLKNTLDISKFQQQDILNNTNTQLYTYKINTFEKLHIIGYKYILINLYIITINILKFKLVKLIILIYIFIISFIFTSKTIKIICDNTKNPLIFLYPIIQILFIYILSPI